MKTTVRTLTFSTNYVPRPSLPRKVGGHDPPAPMGAPPRCKFAPLQHVKFIIISTIYTLQQLEQKDDKLGPLRYFPNCNLPGSSSNLCFFLSLAHVCWCMATGSKPWFNIGMQWVQNCSLVDLPCRQTSARINEQCSVVFAVQNKIRSCG